MKKLKEAWLSIKAMFQRTERPAHYGLAYLDMRGRLKIDVKEALRRGIWEEEVAAARELGERIEREKQRRRRAP